MATRIDVPLARSVLADGAQLVDVLPAAIYRQEHLPGAMSVPLESFATTSITDPLDPSRAVVVYCFDQH